MPSGCSIPFLAVVLVLSPPGCGACGGPAPQPASPAGQASAHGGPGPCRSGQVLAGGCGDRADRPGGVIATKNTLQEVLAGCVAPRLPWCVGGLLHSANQPVALRGALSPERHRKAVSTDAAFASSDGFRGVIASGLQAEVFRLGRQSARAGLLASQFLGRCRPDRPDASFFGGPAAGNP